MTNILDQMARPSFGHFRPKTTNEFFALRLAKRLGDAGAMGHYLKLATEHSAETLLLAYRKALGAGQSPMDMARSFHVELKKLGERGVEAAEVRLGAFKVERRSVAVAVFAGDRLDYQQVRHLSSVPQKAEESVVGFINWVLESCNIESATLEVMTNGHEIQRAALNRAVLTILRENAIPVWEVPKHELLDAFGHPPISSRRELRQITTALLWPMLNGGATDDQILDAAALGFLIQTERSFVY